MRNYATDANPLAALIESEVGTPTCSIARQERVMCPMRDGVGLVTTIVYPEGEGPWPCVLVRNPYADNDETLVDAYVEVVKYGYVLVYQYTRGCGGSEGAWEPFKNERQDGIDCLKWLVEQPFQNGNIGWMGLSYLSYVQWMVADVLPPEVKTLCINVFGVERQRQVYMNGMFRHDIYSWWSLSNAGMQPKGDLIKLYNEALDIRPRVDADKHVYGCDVPLYQDYVHAVSPTDPYWQSGMWHELLTIPPKVKVPIMMIDGWFDHHLDGAVSGWNMLPGDIRKQSKCFFGPWDHLATSPGNLSYPGSNLVGTACIKAHVDWFDHMLKGEPYKGNLGTISCYTVGKGEWEERTSFPPQDAVETPFYLATGSQSYAGGTLKTEKTTEEACVSYDYDPLEKVPTVGGTALLFALQEDPSAPLRGSQKQPEPGYRDDVLTFMSEPLEDDVTVCGRIKVVLTVSTDVDDTAFTAKVCEVAADGVTNNVSDGITSIAWDNGRTEPQTYEPGEKVNLTIDMWPTSWLFKKGSRIRVDVASSNFPAYENHSNFAGPWAEQAETRVAHQNIWVGPDAVSAVVLPVMK